MAKRDEYPGRQMKDEERSAFGLGWEYARRGWSKDDCPFAARIDAERFGAGYAAFQQPSDPNANDAMLRSGVPMTGPAEHRKVVGRRRG